jgi:cytochrome c oxidase subunit I
MIQAHTRRSNLLSNLFPSVISGILLGVIGAIVLNVIVTHAQPADQPANTDAIVVATFLGWAIFFFVGIGAFNGVWKWGFARKWEPS